MTLREIQDMTLRHDGRVLRIEVFVNSAEDIDEVVTRIKKASRGQMRNAAVIMASQFTGEHGAEIWKTLQKMSTEVAASPKAIVVDEDGKPIL